MTSGASAKPMPPHLRELPVDARGFVVPAETPAYSGGDRPLIDKIDEAVNFCLGAARACAVCGLPLRPGQAVWRLHHERDAAVDRELQRKQSFSNLRYPPGHASCMTFSAQVCPFWRRPGARLGRESIYTPGHPRGRATLIGYVDCALIAIPPGQVQFLYYRAETDISFDDPDDLFTTMEPHIRSERIGSRARRVHYAPEFGGTRRLELDLRKAQAALDRAPKREYPAQQYPGAVIAEVPLV